MLHHRKPLLLFGSLPGDGPEHLYPRQHLVGRELSRQSMVALHALHQRSFRFPTTRRDSSAAFSSSGFWGVCTTCRRARRVAVLFNGVRGQPTGQVTG
jgi:hypothetical protein